MKKQGFIKRIAMVFAAALLTVTMIVPAASAQTPEKITLVWYPNESAADYQVARDLIGSLITEATGKPVEQKLTTDYSIAIEALASGQAQICFMGAQGYIQAKEKNANVNPLFVNSGASGTLDDAIYYSWLCAKQADAAQYMDGDKFSIANIAGKKISFVSNSSTSGFKVPSTNIITLFGAQDAWKGLTTDDLVEGGEGKLFSEVLFGGSHQGSAFNLLSGAADVAAFCDTELAPYADLTSGEEEKVGAVYTIKADATAPFDTVTGAAFTIIQSTPVLNGPFAYNADTLSADDVAKIQQRFLAADVAANPDIFITAEGKEAGKVGMFKKTKNECFLLVDDAWYNPIREMGK